MSSSPKVSALASASTLFGLVRGEKEGKKEEEEKRRPSFFHVCGLYGREFAENCPSINVGADRDGNPSGDGCASL